MSKKFTNKLTIYFFEYLNNIIKYIIISVFVVCAVIPGPGVVVGIAIGIIIGVLKTKYKIKNGIFSSQHTFVITLSNLIKFGFYFLCVCLLIYIILFIFFSVASPQDAINQSINLLHLFKD